MMQREVTNNMDPDGKKQDEDWREDSLQGPPRAH